MGAMFQENGFGWVKGARFSRRVLCATLSFAVLNMSLAPVYGMPGSSQGHETVIREDRVKENKHSQRAAQGVFQAAFEEAGRSSAFTPKAAAPMGYGAWVLKGLESASKLAFEGSKGLAGLFSRGVSYALKNPGEALVAVLATQVATVNAIRPLTDEFLVNQNTTRTQINPSIAALGNGNAFVTWQGNQAGAYDVFGRVFNTTGTTLSDELMINQNAAGDQYSPSVTALTNGNAFVSWIDYNSNIYVRGTTPTGIGIGNEVSIIQVNPPSFLLASLNDGNVFLAFESLGTNNYIYGRVLAPNGTALTNNFLINQYYTSGRQYYPSGAALNNGNVFVTWQGTQTGNLDVYGRVMLPNGTALSNEFTLNPNAAGDQSKPSVAPLGNGKIFVVWQSNQNGNLDVYGRFFSENGSVLSNQIKINQVTDGNQANASVTALNNGHAFVVWDGDQTGSSSLYGRVVASNGTFLGDEVSLSRTLTGIQIDPQVKLLKNGNVLVVWVDDRTGTPDVYGRIFDPYSDPVATTSFASTAAVTSGTDPEKILLTFWGVGSSVAATVSLGVSLATLCTIGGFLGFKACKKHQLKKLETNTQQQTDVELGKTDSPADLYGSTNDPHIREALSSKKTENNDTYGTPPEFLPGAENFQGKVETIPETVIKSPSQQSARPKSTVAQPMRPQSVVEWGDEYEKIPTILPEGNKSTRPKSMIEDGQDGEYGRLPIVLPEGNHQ
ncbi:MAG: hypothetical protein ACRCUQ_03440 [Alphaproteobacteria bacterium]